MNRSFRSACSLVCPLAFVVLLLIPDLASGGEARMLRYPTIHKDFVVFSYAGDLWRAPARGGQAFRLTSHQGVELTPKISPDGQWVAYSAEYSGTRQVHVIPAAGGAPKQLTFYNDVGVMPPRGGFDYWIQGWSPDGKILVRMNRTPWGPRPGRYFLVDPAGGLEEPLPIQVGGSADFSPSGTQLAFTYFDREFRTWKRHMGGRNQDIWTFDLEAMESKRLTTWQGSDNFPMWHDDTVYFTSDREHTLNIYAHDTTTAATRKVTDFDEFDVLWPSLGPEAIVFMNGGWLYRLDLATEEVRKIEITVADELPATLERWIDASEHVAAATLSPDGKRVVFEARGDLYSVPANNGATRMLSDTQGVRESSPEWSPDGRWIAYYSDARGEMELLVRSHDGQGEPRRLAEGRPMWLYPVQWSPDSKKMAFANSDNGLEILDVDSGSLTLVDTGERGHLDVYRWSPDSRWLVYETTHPQTELPSLAVYSLADGATSILGDGTTIDYGPAFSQDGKYLFFVSDRNYSLTFSAFEFNYIYNDASRLYASALEPGTAPLFPLESDEVEVDGDGSDDGAENGEEKKNGAEDLDVNVVVEGFANRTVALPGIEAGNYGQLTAIDGAVVYRTFGNDGPPALMHYDLKKKEAKEIASGVGAYVVGAKGETVLYRQGGDWKISAVKPGEEGEKVDLSAVRMKLDPRAEWAQMFDEVWRVGRDWFYDPNMHGVDWQAMKERYGALVPHVSHRSDLDLIFGELIGELEAGHTYGQRGDEPTVERIEGGMLGAELVADRSGRYRIGKIFPSENWHDRYRSPLTEPGVEASEGDFLLAIDGIELTTAQNPYELLEGKADTQVVLTLNSAPSMTGSREETVRTIASEQSLRYLDWIRSRAALVDELSGGQIGYIHLPNTAQEGNEALQKFFYSQVSKPGLIIDDRYNGGGFIPDRMIEMLSRTTLSYWARRGVGSQTTPGFRHDGPKAMLMNGYASSGGDALPYYFRKEGLGKLIGTTTWGGLIGISGNPMLVDGGGVIYPRFRLYDTDGQWAVENIGVEPDIEVWDLPEAIAAGGDPSIEKAVEVLLEELKSFSGDPATPTPPDLGSD